MVSDFMGYIRDCLEIKGRLADCLAIRILLVHTKMSFEKISNCDTFKITNQIKNDVIFNQSDAR